MICYIKTSRKLKGHRETKISMENEGAVPVIMYHYMFTDDAKLQAAMAELQ